MRMNAAICDVIPRLTGAAYRGLRSLGSAAVSKRAAPRRARKRASAPSPSAKAFIYKVVELCNVDERSSAPPTPGSARAGPSTACNSRALRACFVWGEPLVRPSSRALAGLVIARGAVFAGRLTGMAWHTNVIGVFPPFVSFVRCLVRGSVHFLPTASAVIAIERAGGSTHVRFLMPHRTVRAIENIVECARLSPNFVKCLLGEPHRHLGVEFMATAHPMLSPFAACASIDAAAELFRDLRESLAITSDERDFLSLWYAHDVEGEPLPTNDRWVQRLCLRFAGQSPKAINMTSRLAQTLNEDNDRGLYNSLGAFADASHFARVCRAYTGQTPTAWRHMSQTFY